MCKLISLKLVCLLFYFSQLAVEIKLLLVNKWQKSYLQCSMIRGSFPFVRPQLSGRIVFARRGILLHNYLQNNGTCSVTGGGGGVA